MIILTEKADCTGCGACFSVCPSRAIEMLPDDEGFLYPTVNAQLCCDCGACNRCCPIVNPLNQSADVETAYAAYSNDANLRKESSSGGIFSILADNILKEGGVVFGAAFDTDFSVHHIAIQTKDELPQLRGSKYVQSRIENTYIEVKKYLEAGKTVLFSGVMCQIAGLYSFLKKDYERLITVDVLCHGVPSPKVWQKYISDLMKTHPAGITKINLRNKEKGWKSYSAQFVFADGYEQKKKFTEDPYIKFFLDNVSLRPSCYQCRFTAMDRLSDITIGDCWGIQNKMPEMDDDLGTSVVIVHSQKGQTVFVEAMKQLSVKEGELDCLLPPYSGGRNAATPHSKRTDFFEMLNADASTEQLLSIIRQPFKKRFIAKSKHLVKKLLKL